jgi:hypothetical protein
MSTLQVNNLQEYSVGAGVSIISNLNLSSGKTLKINSNYPYAGNFYKADAYSVGFTTTGAGTAQIKAGTVVEVAGQIINFSSATAIVMPTLTAGTDYAIYATTDGSVVADSNFSAPSGYTTANSRKIGGFHYAPGGNAPAQAGGNSTPQINSYSLWDLKWKPSCSNPRGMTLVAGSFWSDIYLTGVDWYTNGTSKYNVAYADGSSPAKIPASYGGNGSSAYANYDWWNATEVVTSVGKRLPNYNEFSALAYGTTEASSVGSEQNSTVLNAAYTSRWGVIQASGVLYTWGNEFGGPYAGASWVATPLSRGSAYNLSNAVLFGGFWLTGSNAGSRCSDWYGAPSFSGGYIGSRAVCDHLILV